MVTVYSVIGIMVAIVYTQLFFEHSFKHTLMNIDIYIEHSYLVKSQKKGFRKCRNIDLFKSVPSCASLDSRIDGELTVKFY